MTNGCALCKGCENPSGIWPGCGYDNAMSLDDDTTRNFLFLQGPHGPFFSRLARLLRDAGVTSWRVSFNRGDQVFWKDKASLLPFRARQEDWPEVLSGHLERLKITDLVLYGDVRTIHAQAVEIARARGLRIHVFEEGYIRPYWATYEREGSNGHSRLMDLPISEMQVQLARAEPEAIEPVATWGELRHHVFYGALYHAFVLLMNGSYREFRPHREISVAGEFRLYLRRLLLMPLHRLRRSLKTRSIRRSGHPYHLVLLQLAHDSNVLAHSPYKSASEFYREVIMGFAEGAPGHHHLVFKAHPLEDGRQPEAREIREIAAQAGLSGRVHYVGGGKLAPLMNHARTAVTINSTAGQQALWRGLPLRLCGRAVYDKPELVSHQPLADFFRAPQKPDLAAYQTYRQYLLETSQLAGGFYSARGRSQLLRQVVDMMLAEDDPYLAFALRKAAPRQQFRTLAEDWKKRRG